MAVSKVHRGGYLCVYTPFHTLAVKILAFTVSNQRGFALLSVWHFKDVTNISAVSLLPQEAKKTAK